MIENNTLTPLGHQILEHWNRYRPAMVRKLTQQSQLQQAIYAAQELTGNLLYDLTVVRKMDYQPAWEIATREWAFLPNEEDQPNCRSIQRASTRINPCPRPPHNQRRRRR
jgi:hypothetical protein